MAFTPVSDSTLQNHIDTLKAKRGQFEAALADAAVAQAALDAKMAVVVIKKAELNAAEAQAEADVLSYKVVD